MEKGSTNPSSIKWLILLSILSLLILLGTYSGQAQDLGPWELNYPIPENPSAPGDLFVFPSGEANSPQAEQLLAVPGISQPQENLPGEMNSSAPDLVITDPNTDVTAEIELLNAVPIGESLVIPAADFTPDGNTRTWFFGFNSAYIYPNSASGYCGIAPLYLPQGATITSFAAYVYDNDATYDVGVSLYPKQLGTTTSATAAASVSSGSQSTALQVLVDTTISPAIVDNTGYTYHIGVCMWGADSNSRFYAVQIHYTR